VAKLASDFIHSGLPPAVSRNCAPPTWLIELRARFGARVFDDSNDHGVEIGDLVV